MTETLLRRVLCEASRSWTAPVSTYGLMQALRAGRPLLVLTDAEADDGVAEPFVVEGPEGQRGLLVFSGLDAVPASLAEAETTTIVSVSGAWLCDAVAASKLDVVGLDAFDREHGAILQVETFRQARDYEAGVPIPYPAAMQLLERAVLHGGAGGEAAREVLRRARETGELREPSPARVITVERGSRTATVVVADGEARFESARDEAAVLPAGLAVEALEAIVAFPPQGPATGAPRRCSPGDAAAFIAGPDVTAHWRIAADGGDLEVAVGPRGAWRITAPDGLVRFDPIDRDAVMRRVAALVLDP
jgi:hypothetical protein